MRIEPKRILTPIIDYSRAEQNVHIIGVIHFGTRNYYRRIQRLIDKYPVGLYEGIDYYSEAYKDKCRAEEESMGDETLEQCAKYAGLKEQSLNYRNWKNVDIKLKEIPKRSKGDVAKLRSFKKLTDILDEAQKKDPEALSRAFKDIVFKIFSGILTVQYRRDAIERERESLLCAALEKKLESGRITDIGIIYGAMHIYCLDKFLMENDFEITKEKWIPAIEITEKLSLKEAEKRLDKIIPASARF